MVQRTSGFCQVIGVTAAWSHDLDYPSPFCYVHRTAVDHRTGLAAPTLFTYLMGSIFGYLLGSVPTAFLLVRWKSRIDIRKAGSGNVGTLNSFQVSGSKLVGLAVLALDFAKGFGAVALTSSLPGSDFTVVACAGVAAVLGHNFPVWLRFHGGRGLATAAGVFSFLCVPAVGFWGLIWVPGFQVTRNVNVANTGATLLLMVALWVVPGDYWAGLLTVSASTGSFRWFSTAALLVILLRHMQPVLQFMRGRNTHRDQEG